MISMRTPGSASNHRTLHSLLNGGNSDAPGLIGRTAGTSGFARDALFVLALLRTRKKP